MTTETTSYYDQLLELAKTDKFAAATKMVIGFMRGSRPDMKLGYSLGNALIGTADTFNLTINEIGVVLDRVTSKLGEHYSSSPRPLVIIEIEDGYLRTIHRPGIGSPEIHEINADRTDDDLLASDYDFVVKLLRKRNPDDDDAHELERQASRIREALRK